MTLGGHSFGSAPLGGLPGRLNEINEPAATASPEEAQEIYEKEEEGFSAAAKELSSEAKSEVVNLLSDLVRLYQQATFPDKFLKLARWWLLGIFAIIVAQGALGPHGWFNLSDKVLITIIAGSTGALSLISIFAKYLFRHGAPPRFSRSRRKSKSG